MDPAEPLRHGLSIVIPVYNSEAGLQSLVERLESTLPQIAPVHEVILVNDASRDGSQARIRALAEGRPWLRWIELRRNFGQHAAVLCGLRAARHEITVTMDDDLQHPPEQISTLLARLTADIDVVYGSPEEEQHGLFRDAASRLTKWALRASMGVDVAPHVSAFRVLRTEIRESFATFDGAYVQLDALLAWGTNRFDAVRVPHDERKFGTSNYTFGKLVRIALELVTGFSERPLRAASIAGIAFAGLGLLLLTYVVLRYILDDRGVPGFAFLACSISIFSGIQLVALGVIGEYLARVHSRTMRKPTYFVRTRSEDGSLDG